MKKVSILISTIILVALSCMSCSKNNDSFVIQENSTLKENITIIRDAFTTKLNSLGLSTTNIPAIIIQNTPAMISYGPEGLTVPDWQTLDNGPKTMFNSWTDQANGGFTGEEFFKKSFNWFFVVHELGHYVQNLKGTENGPSQYQTELTANKIAIAYWKQKDPEGLKAYMIWLNKVLQVIPVPTGTSEAYYNANYIAQTANNNFNGYFQFFFVQQACLDIDTLNLSDFL